jgi:hypothetical protein
MIDGVSYIIATHYLSTLILFLIIRSVKYNFKIHPDDKFCYLHLYTILHTQLDGRFIISIPTKLYIHRYKQ